ncbi:multifunctional CCA addition/repair protein [Thiomicrorhabdus sp. 6S2-11]|uniref:Multifunctional CCA protein n=1 Tax=Thiomicrorhabdus marina TaxID=2818442 RepID=A0ABS3Q2T0_9GAMM|nr:multifunctional CCA addition/repair protein [Thiomicrorhabdus marina]MBO1926423.1 multifunctional CCA addition/repair protein [Thiomicrorhabdus marina]
MQIYLVGGAVRDALLDIAVYDRDWVVVGATPQQMLDGGYQQVGKDFPVFLHPDSKDEYALARTERKQGSGYHGFEVFAEPSVTLEDDLIRRDLTINAMAQAEDGTIIDPYGGQQDLQNRVLRHVSDAFSEDPLRVLRVARFAAKLAPFGFTLAQETKILMTQMVASGELAELTPERVWQEVVKVLNSVEPSRFFEVLDEVGATEVLFPELHALHGVEQPEKHHPEGDVWIHTMMVLQQATKLSDDLAVRFAALVHDLGKGITPPELWPKHHGHEAAGVPLVKALCQRYRVPKKIEQFACKVTEYHGVIHSGLKDGAPYLKPKTYHKVLQNCGAYKDAEAFTQVLIACKADARGRLGFEEVDYPQLEFWQAVQKVAAAVDNKAIIAQGFQGKEIAEQIEKTRINNISQFIQS